MRRRTPRDLLDALPAPLGGAVGFIVLVLCAAALAAALLLAIGVLERDEVEPAEVLEAALAPEPGTDPFAWSPDRREELERRAAFGNSHVLYALSPGGAEASARRTARWRDEIEAAADEHGVSAGSMEAMVMLESAGRPEAIAGGTDPAAASGLAQILASTGIALLGMDIDLERSRALTETIVDNAERAQTLRRRAARLADGSDAPRRDRRRARSLLERSDRLERRSDRASAERARVDPRFDPEGALDGMGRYLAIASERFGREDLAVASYHMGIGNLETVIGAFLGERTGEGRTRELVADNDLTFAELYFDSSPLRNPDAWEVLDSLADDSPTYLWRVLAAEEIMRLWREDREELRRLADLHDNKATAEEVFHPPGETDTFADPGELRDALDAGDLVAIPGGREARGYGLRVGRQLGELSEQLGADRELYRALRPEALAALIYMTGRVQAITGRPRQTLTVTSAVRDAAYQDALVGRNPEATDGYSLHTTGYAFDILREYANNRQARAFQFVLDRMRSLGVIDYAVEPRAIHVTASPGAEALLR